MDALPVKDNDIEERELTPEEKERHRPVVNYKSRYSVLADVMTGHPYIWDNKNGYELTIDETAALLNYLHELRLKAEEDREVQLSTESYYLIKPETLTNPYWKDGFVSRVYDILTQGHMVRLQIYKHKINGKYYNELT